jgi:GMP synthase (glutamine-hydrolysing)
MSTPTPRPRLAVVDASLGGTLAQRNFSRDLDADLTFFRAAEGEMPPAFMSAAYDFDGLVVSGSEASVYDDRPWIGALTDWVGPVLAARHPVLGVCWGHQFIAQALGGTVADRGAYELGYTTVHQVAPTPLFEDLSSSFTTFETHSDEVTALPSDAELLARNDASVQAFRHGAAYGVQFHPEYDARSAEYIIKQKDIDPSFCQAALDTITDANVAAARRTKHTVFANFLDRVSAHRAA